MSKKKAVKTEHLSDIPLDRPGMFLRVERRHWEDGTSCLHIAKWGTQPSGKPAPWIPLQYMQVPWEMSEAFLMDLSHALHSAKGAVGQ